MKLRFLALQQWFWIENWTIFKGAMAFPVIFTSLCIHGAEIYKNTVELRTFKFI